MSELYIRPFTIENRATGESLNANVFRGTVGLCVFEKGGGRPSFKCNFTPYLFKVFDHVCDKIRKASPETKISLKKEKFDRDSKTWSNEWVIVLAKDSALVYHITLTDCTNGNRTFNFAIKGVSGISIGSDQMSDADKSGFMFDAFTDWIAQAKLTATWTDEKYDPKKAGGNRGGGGNYNNNRGGGNYNNNNPSNNGGNEDDDLPF